MKKSLVILTLIAALAAVGVSPLANATSPQGCAAVNPSGAAGCTYIATQPGNILGVNQWTVNVWWDGSCGPEAANWTVSSASGSTGTPGEGNNVIPGLVGGWEGSIAAGSCAQAIALAPGSAVAIGS